MDIKTVNLEKLAAETAGLPILPPVTGQIINHLIEDDVTSKSLTSIIEADHPLSQRILRVVNSPFFGFNREIYTIYQAVVSLGFNVIKNILLELSIVGANQEDGFPIDMKTFAEDSLTSAVALKLIINHFEPNLEETAFATGFLMNIGQPLFALHYPEEYRGIVKQAESNERKLDELEKRTFMYEHAQLSALMARRWGFDELIADPILYHHTPDPTLEKKSRDSLLIPAAYIATLAVEVFRSKAKKESLDFCLAEAKRRMDLSEDTTHQILENISHRGKEIAQYFDFSLSLSLSYSKVLHAITVQLGEINLTYEQMVKELRKSKVEAEKLAHQLRIANEELKKRVDLDGLTGIFNHRYFQEHFMVEFMRSVRYGSPLSVVLFDVDHFKLVNDNYGHLTGDEVLREFAAILKKCTRVSDYVARYGGEEFIMVLPETSSDGAYIVAEKIRHRVENHRFMHEGKTPVKVTVSAGIASLEAGRKYETTNLFISAADKKMYRAKKGGRNQVVK
ncbi:MAG: GGDEF domain-containing protein [FCB group bacterium]|nr:GGDEF domain-containing protein [FCB group bacterium]